MVVGVSPFGVVFIIIIIIIIIIHSHFFDPSSYPKALDMKIVK
jgi:hypothetical protein